MLRMSLPSSCLWTIRMAIIMSGWALQPRIVVVPTEALDRKRPAKVVVLLTY